MKQHKGNFLRAILFGILSACLLFAVIMMRRDIRIREGFSPYGLSDPEEAVSAMSGSSSDSENSGGETAAGSGYAVKTGSTVTSDSSESVSAESVSSLSENYPDISDQNGTVTISAAGDCTLGTDENFDPSGSFDTVYDSVGDPSYFFSKVRDVFANDDLTIVNLEGTLTDSTDRQDKTYAFKGDPSYTEILTDGSVEAANLANNHSHDYGDESYEDTIENLKEADITSFGYDSSPVIEINGIRIGLVGTYELADGIDCKDDMLQQIKSVRENGASLVIVSFHWGTERADYPDDTQVELAHAAIDAGADLVLGHHPHVLEGIETYHGRKIVYSLGNFCFGGNNNPSDKDTMIYQQTFHIQNGKVSYSDSDTEEDSDFRILPCSISSSSSRNNFQPVVLTGEEATRVQERIRELSDGLSTDPDPG